MGILPNILHSNLIFYKDILSFDNFAVVSIFISCTTSFTSLRIF